MNHLIEARRMNIERRGFNCLYFLSTFSLTFTFYATAAASSSSSSSISTSSSASFLSCLSFFPVQTYASNTYAFFLSRPLSFPISSHVMATTCLVLVIRRQRRRRVVSTKEEAAIRSASILFAYFQYRPHVSFLGL